MSPSVGRIVLYNHPGDATGRFGRKQSPAVITHVHSYGLGNPAVVDLFVMTAPTLSYDNHEGEARCVAGGGTYHNLKVEEGDGPLQWSWPVREGE